MYLLDLPLARWIIKPWSSLSLVLCVLLKLDDAIEVLSKAHFMRMVVKINLGPTHRIDTKATPLDRCLSMNAFIFITNGVTELTSVASNAPSPLLKEVLREPSSSQAHSLVPVGVI